MRRARQNPSGLATAAWIAGGVVVGGLLGFAGGSFLCGRRGAPGPDDTFVPPGEGPVRVEFTGSRCTIGEWTFQCDNLIARLGDETRGRRIVLDVSMGSHAVVERALQELEDAGFTDVSIEGDD